MADKSKIEWTDSTWNPVVGCTKVSEGCRNCYAASLASRFSGPGMPMEGTAKGGNWTGKILLKPEALSIPLRWRKPRKIFVCSMSDLFHEDVPVEFLFDVFNVMASATANCGKRHQHEEECWCGDAHTFILLTKRPNRMYRVLTDDLPDYASYQSGECLLNVMMEVGLWPLPNVWLGVSVEDQQTADDRIPRLLNTPAAVRFVSYEPALGPVDFRFTNSLVHGEDAADYRLDWVIAGGESGPNARPAHPDWFRSVRDQCAEAGTPFFFKQFGEHDEHFDRVGKRATGCLLDGVEHKEFPLGVKS